MTQMSEEEILKLATKRVQAKRGFWTHFSVYCVVNAFLIILWAITGISSSNFPNYPWFIWTMLPWGVGMVFHALAVFVWSRPGYDRASVEKEAAKIRGGQ
jgi:hypothetical protein